MMPIRSCWFALLAILLAVRVGLGDGCMMAKQVGRSTKMVASPKQEALLVTDGQTVQVILRTHFRAGPEELAWVVPVPSKPTAVEEGQEEIFQKLERACAPEFLRFSGKGGVGCACSGLSMRSKGVAGKSVVVEAVGTAGIFQYVVLSATGAEELTQWLNQHEYRVPEGAEGLFQRYVKQGWHWLAMRVRPEAAAEGTLAPHPVAYTYADSKLVYPLVISQLSADKTNEIVLYVVGRDRYACSNWKNATIQELTSSGRDLRLEAGSPSGTNYEKVFAEATRLGKGRLFVTEYAGRYAVFTYGSVTGGVIEGESVPQFVENLGDEQWLTRLRGVMAPEAMDRDVVLVPVPTWLGVHNALYLSAGRQGQPAAASLAAVLCALAALSVGSCLTSRPGWRRAVGSLCVLAGCLIFTML